MPGPTDTVTAALPTPGGDRPHPTLWRTVAALALSQTIGYGVLYYPFAVLLTPMQQALHTGPVAITGAFTVSALAGAVAAVPVGRWLDRHGGRALMAAGSVLATLLVVAWSQVHSIGQLYAVWLALGVVSAAVLYEAAFAVVVALSGPTRRANALLAVTVVAGFASSIFLPLTGALTQEYGWRTALLILAAVHGAVTVPLHLLVPRPSDRPAPTRHKRDTGAVNAALRDPGYRLLAVVFVAQGTAVAIVAVHLVAYLQQLGHPAAFAATIAGLLGVLSVTGRLATTGLGRRYATHHVTATVFVLQAGGAIVLVTLGETTAGAIVAVLAFGIGFGVATIARPAILANRYGTTGYATIAAVLAVPLTIAKATAPLAASLVRQVTGGYAAVGLTVAALCLLAATGLATLRPVR